MAKQSIYIDEVKTYRKGYKRFFNFTHSSTKAAAVMLVAAVIALFIANSAWYEPFRAFWDTEIGFSFGGNYSSMKLSSLVNDVLMTLFFLLVGLEIKYEMTVGELTNIRRAILPIVAAIGGVLAPIGIYLFFNGGNPETVQGWGVPTATDIAFALGLLSLLGSKVPSGVRVFLTTLAVADDIIAIIIIAVFYGHSPSPFWLILSAVVLLVLVGMNKFHVYSLAAYLLVGGILWFCVFQSGIHSTIAGVLLAFAIPSGSRINLKSFTEWSEERVRRAAEEFDPDEPIIGQQDYLRHVGVLSSVAQQVIPPATRLEKMLYPWVYFLVMPLFALTNADVCLAGITPSMLFGDTVFLGVALGLLLGKPIGILAASFLVVKIGKVSLPEKVTWGHMAGAAILGGVGFTMSIFVANLAFADPSHVVVAKTAILSASTVAGVAGLVFLSLQARACARKGVVYVKKGADSLLQQTADVEAARESAEAINGARKEKVDLLMHLRRMRKDNIEFNETMKQVYGDAVKEVLSDEADALEGETASAPGEEGLLAAAGDNGGDRLSEDENEQMARSMRLWLNMMSRKNVDVTRMIVEDYVKNMESNDGETHRG